MVNNENEIAILLLLDMINFLMNIYTIGRMFKTFICKSYEYCPDPTFIICYFGKRHTDDIKNFLKEKLYFEEVFNIDNSDMGNFQVVNIQNLPQPVFGDI